MVAKIPISPAPKPTMTVSALNTLEISFFEAPIARRMPISIRTLKDADIGYDAESYVTLENNKAYSNKCYENIGYDVDYRSH